MEGTIQIHLQKIGHLVNVQEGKCCSEQHQVIERAGWEDAARANLNGGASGSTSMPG